jgi:hypothetical protein
VLTAVAQTLGVDAHDEDGLLDELVEQELTGADACKADALAAAAATTTRALIELYELS